MTAPKCLPRCRPIMGYIYLQECSFILSLLNPWNLRSEKKHFRFINIKCFFIVVYPQSNFSVSFCIPLQRLLRKILTVWSPSRLFSDNCIWKLASKPLDLSSWVAKFVFLWVLRLLSSVLLFVFYWLVRFSCQIKRSWPMCLIEPSCLLIFSSESFFKMFLCCYMPDRCKRVL